MATGLLVLLVGEATKLSPFLSMERKRYRTEVRLGVGTTSLDADGAVREEASLSGAWLEDLGRGVDAPGLRAVLAQERDRREQIPPSVSAIHVDGVRAHERVRRGEEVLLPPRAVQVFSLDLLAVTLDPVPTLTLELEVSKGYYVRSLGRDLGQALGVPAHLSALRRLQSGSFRIEGASTLDAPPRLLSLEESVRCALPVAELTERGAWKAVHGQALQREDFMAPPATLGPHAWFSSGGLLAVGEEREGDFRVLRGFRSLSA
jgi:tRNA pseudouridine55 synthase